MGEVTEGMMDAKVNSNELIQMLLGNPGIYNLRVLKKLKGKVEAESSHLYQCHCGKLGTAISLVIYRTTELFWLVKNHPVPALCHGQGTRGVGGLQLDWCW